MRWSFPWASSDDGDFNYDFNVSFTEAQQRGGEIEYNFRREPPLQEGGWGKILDADAPAEDGSRSGRGPTDDNAAMTGTDTATYSRERPGITASSRSTLVNSIAWAIGSTCSVSTSSSVAT